MSALMMTQQLRAPSKSALAAAPRRCAAAAPRGAVRVRAAASIVDTAVAAGNFKTLVAALTAAGASRRGAQGEGWKGTPGAWRHVVPVPRAAGAARAPIARAWCHTSRHELPKCPLRRKTAGQRRRGANKCRSWS